MSTWNFVLAVNDYRFLKNNQYSEKSALVLVGDRYQLTKIQRNCLRRGVVVSKKKLERKSKIVGFRKVRGRVLAIDWYNVLITIESYLKGIPLFLADDGVLRDAAAVHGSYRKTRITDRAIEALLTTLIRMKPKFMAIFIDEPVSFSGKMVRELTDIFEKVIPVFPVSIRTVRSADFELKKSMDIVASSDSVVIDEVQHFVDLPRIVLCHEFLFNPPTLDEMVFH